MNKELIRKTFDKNGGVLHMLPNYIPVKFGVPGRRLKLHPSDYYSFGMKAGTIMERWLCSLNGTRVKNPTRPDQGMSYAVTDSGERFLLKEAVETLGEELIGKQLQETYGTFPVFSKFFDYETPLYFHFHPGNEIAKKVGCEAKPECYYFPPQLNNYKGRRPSTYIGFNTGVEKDEVRWCIEHFNDCDTNITRLSRAFDLEIGTGWYIPAGVIHAPGSLLTYEPQWGTDLNCVLENVVCGEIFDEHYMKDIIPKDVTDYTEYIMQAIDWETNFDVDFKKNYFRPPITLAQKDSSLIEKWVCYGNDFITSKEVTVLPGGSVTLLDKAAYGCVIVQGFGTFAGYHAEAVNMNRVGDVTADEFFVSRNRACEGVEIVNNSKVEPMVILQHFGPDNAVYVK